jgi:hypothetical protein
MKIIWMSEDGLHATAARGWFRFRVADISRSDVAHSVPCRSAMCSSDSHATPWCFNLTGDPIDSGVLHALERHKARQERQRREARHAGVWRKMRQLPMARVVS